MTIVVAHRGDHATYGENTVAAFRAAGPSGAEAIELDVRRAAGSHLVVHHDPDVADGRQIRSLRPGDMDSSIPSLAEALQACSGLVVNIELKDLPGEEAFCDDGEFETMVASEVADVGWLDHVWFSSFDATAMTRLRSALPTARIALLLMEFGDAAATFAAAQRDGYTAVHPWDPLVDAASVALAKEHGLDMHVWTVNDAARIEELTILGVAGIMTDHVALARSIVDRVSAGG